MIDINLLTPYELMLKIAQRVKEKRLFLNFTQKSLSERSGVSLGTLKKFEGTGKISLESLLQLALVLDALKEFATLFQPKEMESYSTLNELLSQKRRQRGRK